MSFKMFNTKLALLLFVVGFSTFLANIAYQIDLDVYQSKSLKYDIRYKATYKNLSKIGDSADQLMWFVQISDLHLSIFNDPLRITQLEEFCCSTLDIIRPSVVIASGDLTDAKHKDNMGSGQYKEEWITYAETMKTCKVKEKTLWLDIRGNHDNFNVAGWKSENNFFRNYSVQGHKNPRSYLQILEKGGQKFAFVGLDACLELGPKRPFNFIGMLTRDNVVEIKSMLAKAKEIGVDHTVWFGHYPTSCIISLSDDPVRKLIGDLETSKVYLCGHLHQMGGLITKMYTRQKPGFLELELGDWKDNRMFRLAAFDHNLFNFVDVQHGTWPIILITNPKNALFALPDREPLIQLQTSSHIRVLAFSVSPIVSVEVKINSGNWIQCVNSHGPLYTTTWSSQHYNSGIHIIYAKVKDEQGRMEIVEQPFSIDVTKVDFDILSRVVLMLDASIIFQCLFGTMLLVSTLPLIIMRYMHKKILTGNMIRPRFRKNLFYIYLRKLWILSTVDELFYPLVIYDIYLCFGPWAIGELMEGYIGAVFAWGLLVNGVFIPGSFTYMYGFIQLFVCQFPLTLFLAHQVDRQFQRDHLLKKLSHSKISLFFNHLPFIFILAMNMHFAYFFGLAYGIVAFILGPLRSWSVILNLYVWYKAINVTPKQTREAAIIWIVSNSRQSKRNIDFDGF